MYESEDQNNLRLLFYMTAEINISMNVVRRLLASLITPIIVHFVSSSNALRGIWNSQRTELFSSPMVACSHLIN